MSTASPSPAREPATPRGLRPAKRRPPTASSCSKEGSAGNSAPSFEDGRITVSIRTRPLNTREEKLSVAATPSAACSSANPASNTAATGVPAWIFAGGPNCLKFSEDGKTVMVFDGGVPVDYNQMTREQMIALQQRRSHTFTFDHAYDGDISQETVYDDLGKPVLKASFLGFNTCIFAYGQTGSGKSYCMMGPDGGRSATVAPGIIPRLCGELFAEVEARKLCNSEEIARAKEAADRREAQGDGDAAQQVDGGEEEKEAMAGADKDGNLIPAELEVFVYVSYLEIYREKVRCLLHAKSDNLKVRQHPTLGVYVEGLKEVPVSHVDQIVKLMKAGTESRHTASTMMNDTSSRSHAIFQLQLVQKRTSATKDGAAKTTELRSRINLVDLAGSERAKATGAEGETLREGAQINKSLSTLGLVISALAELSNSSSSDHGTSAKHIPYRDSTLTFLLKESLGGNSKTYMLSTLSPATINYDETLSTLRYADRAKQIVTRAFVNETAGDKRIRELEDEVTRLRDKIQRMLADQQLKKGVAAGGDNVLLNNLLLSSAMGAGSRARSNTGSPSATRRRGSGSGSVGVGASSSRRSSRATVETSATALTFDEDLLAEVLPDPLHGNAERRRSSARRRRSTTTRDDPNDESEEEEACDEDIELVDDSQLLTPALAPTAAIADTTNLPRLPSLSALAGSPPALTFSPTGTGAGAGADVETLQSELQRAEEVIRQLTATETDREKEVGDVLAEFRAQSTVKLNRTDPYLLNLDGLGDWVVAHLLSKMVYVGAATAADGAPPRLADEEKKNKDASGEEEEEDTLYDDDLESGGDDDEEDAEEEEQVNGQRRHTKTSARIRSGPQYVTVTVLADDGDAVGAPHCKLLCRSGQFSLLPCRDFQTFVNNDLDPLVGECALQNGDIITLGHANTGPQLKFIDPSAPQQLMTARGARTRLAGGGAVSSLTRFGFSGTPDNTATATATAAAAAGQGITTLGGMALPPLNIPQRGRDTHVHPTTSAGAAAEAASFSFHSSEEMGEEEEEEGAYASSEFDDGDGAEGAEAIAAPTATAVKGVPPLSIPLVPALQLGGLAKKRTPADSAAAGGATQPSTNKGTRSISGADKAKAALTKDQEAETYFGDKERTATTTGVVRGSVVHTGASASLSGTVRKGTVVGSERMSTGPQLPGSVATRFVGRHTLLFLGPSGAGKTHTRENLRDPDRWFDFLTKREPLRVKPTWGVDRCIVDVDDGIVRKPSSHSTRSGGRSVIGDSSMSLALLELSGRSCFSLLQDQLPARRVTYVLCFSLRQNPTLQVFRHTLEYILCQSDHRDASVVLLGTHYSSSGDSSSSSSGGGGVLTDAQVHDILDDIEQQVQNFFLLLQPNAELRPTIVGRFAVDNASRKVFSAGYARVSTFPELLLWFSDHALQRCRNDLDFLNGRVPCCCTDKLAVLAKKFKTSGKWCTSSSDYKARAKALDLCYTHAHTLHTHTQLLGHWGFLVHRFRHAKMKAHVVVDVPWYLKLLACVACCGAAWVERPDEILLCSYPIMHAYDPEALHFSPEEVILADAYGLLSRGVMTTKVLATIVRGLLNSEDPPPSTVSYQRKDRPDLMGIVALFQTCDYVVPGRRLSFSPEKTNTGTPLTASSSSSFFPSTAGRGEVSLLTSSDFPPFESFLLLPSTFFLAAPPTVVQHTTRLLTGPFYRFTFSMVPPFFFAKLNCRLANDVCETLYVGPVQKWVVESDGPHFPLYTGKTADERASSSRRNTNANSGDVGSEKAQQHRPSQQPRGTVVPGNPQFWALTTWARGCDGARAFLRMVNHSLFIAFNHTNSYKTEDATFYEDVLAAVRSVVAESPGTRCEESLLCCLPEDVAFAEGGDRSAGSSATTLLSSASSMHDTMLDTDPKCFYRPVNENINSLEKIREREACALQTARTQRPALPRAGGEETKGGAAAQQEEAAEEEEEETMPFLRSFADTPLSIVKYAQLVDRTCPMRREVKERLEGLLDRLAEAREHCDDCPNDGSSEAVAAASAVGRTLDVIVDALAVMK